jgi:Methyltransferase domain
MGAEILFKAGEELLPEAASVLERSAVTSLRLLEEASPNALRYEAMPSAAHWADMERNIARRISKSTVYTWEPGNIVQNLRIPEAELNTPGFNILDVGAGEQRLAKAVDSRGWASRVHSVEPRLGISQKAENMTSHPTDLARLRPAHPLAVAAMADNLPFENGYFNRLYAHFSSPYYIDNRTEIHDSLTEMMRVLRGDGIGRIFPLTERHKAIAEGVMRDVGRDFEMTYMYPVMGGAYERPEFAWRLTTIPKL